MDEKRYKSIMKRDFEYNLELYLYDSFLKRQLPEVSEKGFTEFINRDLQAEIEQYREACQKASSDIIKDELKIKDADEKIIEWYKYNKSLIVNFENIFFDYFGGKLSSEEFKKIYNESKQCHYCGIHEDDIESLIANSDIKTKRLLTRGKSLEIDRIDPFGRYTEDNIILSCYWCNNAKTDEFSYCEFKDNIARGIQKVWEKRLKRSLNPPESINYNDKTSL